MSNPMKPFLLRVVGNKLFWPILALSLLLLFNFVFKREFFDLEIKHDPEKGGFLYGTLVDIVRRSSPQMLLALGMTLVIATYGIDLSVGSVVAITGTLAAYLVAKAHYPLAAGAVTHYPFAIAVLITLLVATAAGVWNGALVAYVGVQPIVATLILIVAGRGIARLPSEGQMVWFDTVRPYVFMTNGYWLYLPFCAWIVAFVFLLTWLLTRRTAIGMMIEAVGNNETASNFCGINARRVKLFAYGYCGFTAGIAGMLAASSSMQADPAKMGQWMELDAIFAVVVGGTSLAGGRFSLVGSIIGAILLMSLTQTMYYLGVNPWVAPVPKAIVIVAVCLLQSEKFRRWVMGFFRRHAR